MKSLICLIFGHKFFISDKIVKQDNGFDLFEEHTELTCSRCGKKEKKIYKIE